MKIALAQINPTVGDIAGNAEIIRRFLARARQAGARLVVFPELALLGYPPRDLLLKPDMVQANLRALESLAPEARGIAAVVGYVDRNPAKVGRPLHNALALLDGGRIAARKFKTLLPTYDVFDEARYFEPGPAAVVVDIDATRFGLSICEDIWNPEDPESRQLYPRDPIADLAAQGPDVIVNISASPFILGKYETRLKLLQRQAALHRRPILYCNQVGGNDELIFDGASLALDAAGRLLAQARDFEEDLIVFDLPCATHKQQLVGASLTDEPPPQTSFAGAATSATPYQVRTGVASLHAALVLGLRDYFRKCGFQDAVLGLSGGIDSAVVACLAAEALGPDHVLTVALPSRYSAAQSATDAERLARNLGIRFSTIPIAPLHDAFEQALTPIFAGTQPGLAEENVQARIRGVLLMALSNKFGRLLLATGNKSELATGYCTLYGDMCGGLAPIGDVPKTFVYELARHLNRQREVIPEAIIRRPPTAELKPNQLDQDTLPPYDQVDRFVQRYVEDLVPAESLKQEGQDAGVVERLVRMVDGSEYKRRQAAPVLKVTGRAFGVGRRMPIAQRYRPMK